jgi:hypothetical protein
VTRDTIRTVLAGSTNKERLCALFDSIGLSEGFVVFEESNGTVQAVDITINYED